MSKSTLQVADLFCGAGGTSTGLIQEAEKCGRRVELTAVNHWPTAIATHTDNHPNSRHLCTGIDEVDPRSLFKFGKLDVLWASPECTHHSRARGGKPMHEQSRATAWCVTRWAEALLPGIIFVENVPEFLEWGPLGSNGRPLKRKKGHTFRAWAQVLESLGYQVEWRILCAADYGAATTRRRLFVQAVRGRRKIRWPERTHAPALEIAEMQAQGDFFAGDLQPWRSARSIIDWDLKGRWLDEMPAKPQFDGLPLSPKTLKRIHAGLEKYGLKGCIVPIDHTGRGRVTTNDLDAPLSTVTTEARHAFIEPYMVDLRGTAPDQIKASARSVEQPLAAITAGGRHQGLIEPHLLPQHGGGSLRPVSEPCPTVACAGAIALVEPQPFLTQFYGTATASSIDEPMPTATTKDRFGLVCPQLVTADGHTIRVRLRWRMLQPHELAAGQSFPKDYEFSGTKTEAVKQIGNAVPPAIAAALIRPHLDACDTPSPEKPEPALN